MSEILVVCFVISVALFISYMFGRDAGWYDGRTVYRIWDSRRFTEILAKHLDIQTDDGCEVDYVRQAIRSAKDEYETTRGVK